MADVPAIRITAVDDASRVIAQIGKSLGGLAASVASASTIIQTFRSALEFGDQLQTTNEQLGLSVDKLQELSAIAVQTGTSLSDFGRAYKALAQAMTLAQNSTSEQARLFRALGVAVKDAQGNLRPLEDVTADAADALNKVGNETTRTAAGIVIFGRGYLEVAASLRTYRTAQEDANRIIAVFGTVTATAAASADQLGDKIKLVEQGFKAATLNEMAGGFAALSAEIDGTTSSISEFAHYVGHGFALDMRDGAVIVTRFQQAFEILGTLASRTWEAIKNKSREPLAQMGKDIDAIVLKYEAARGAIRSAFAAPGLDNQDQVSRAAGAADRIKQARIDSKAVQDALNTTGIDAFDQAMARMRKETVAAAAALEEAFTGEKVPAALTKILQEMEDPGWAKFTAAQQLRLQLEASEAIGLQQEAAAVKKLRDETMASIEATEKAAEAQQKLVDSRVAVVSSFSEGNDRLKQENDLIGANATQHALLTAQIEYETAAKKLAGAENDIALDQLKAEYETRKKLITEGIFKKEQLDEALNFWNQIDQAGHDAFTHIYEGGKSVLERLLNSLKQIALELAYMAAKKWVLQIAVGATGAGGAGAASAGGLGNLLGLLGGGAGGTAAGALGSNLGILASGGGLESIGGLAGLGSSMAAFAAANAVPIIGTVIAVGGALIYNWLESKKGGPKTGGFATSGTTGMLGGYTDSSGRFVTPADADAQVKQYTDATLKSYKEFAKAFGITAVVGFAQGFTSDPQGKAGNILHTQAFLGGKSIYDVALGDLGRDSQVLADRIALENKRALIAAIKATDLPGVLSGLFKNVIPETITSDAADSLLTFANAYKSLYDAFNANPLDDALNAVADAAAGAQRAVEKQGDALLTLLDTYDGTAQATTDLATATQAYYTNVVALIAQIENLKTSISDMFAATIKQFTFAKLDKGGQYKYLQSDVQSSYAALQMTTSAPEIDRLTKLIDQDLRDMFGLLSPQDQASQADQFIKNTNLINQAAQSQLQKAEKAAEDRTNAILTAIKSAIDQAATNLTGAADDLSGAADDLSGAAGARQPTAVNS